MQYFVYIMSNKLRGTLYVGVTNDLVRRVYEHKTLVCDGFVKKYKLKKLIYFECYENINLAIQREKNLKHWSKEWKIILIEKMNPEWTDLYLQLI
ncbi:MAG: GIY-YIG nuclease family protein [Pseudomonadota bacterium]|nr:GIY-YIG nuclease family protein [Pseudomonadota bacterium]